MTDDMIHHMKDYCDPAECDCSFICENCPDPMPTVDEEKEKLIITVTTGCLWSDTGLDDNGYETGCGNAFQVLVGTPAENEMLYCPFCGKKIVLNLNGKDE